MKISKDQADVYKIIADIFQKLLLTIVFIITFCIVMYFLITVEPKWSKTLPLGIIEGLLVNNVRRMVLHFYPTK